MNGLNTALNLFSQTFLCNLIDNILIQTFPTLSSLFLYKLANLLTTYIHKRCQMRQGKGLSAVLITGYLSYNLGCNVTGCKKAMGLFNHGLTDNSTVLKHILQIDQITVMLLLGEIIGIMKMNNALLVSLHDLLRQKYTFRKVLTNLAGHVVSLCRINNRILIGILLIHFFINMINQSQNTIICGIRLTSQLPLISIAHILLGNLVSSHPHNAGLYHILNIFYMNCVGHLLYLMSDIVRDGTDLIVIHSVNIVNFVISLNDGMFNLFQIKYNLLTIALNNFCSDFQSHSYLPLFFIIY